MKPGPRYIPVDIATTFVGAVCILSTIALPVGLFLAPAGVLLTVLPLIPRRPTPDPSV